jgi:hypothetical protein
MNNSVKRLLKFAALMAMSTLLVLPAAGVAQAESATVTHHVVQDTMTIAFVNPCTGESGTAVITYTAILEETDRPNDTFSLVNNFSGDFVLSLDSAAIITGDFVNTFVIGGGENLTLSSVLTAQGTASDGSRFSLHFMLIQAENGLGILVVDLSMC